jgi:hypothetical protein
MLRERTSHATCGAFVDAITGDSCLSSWAGASSLLELSAPARDWGACGVRPCLPPVHESGAEVVTRNVPLCSYTLCSYIMLGKASGTNTTRAP